MLGKKIRMNRIFNKRTKRTVIVPMDHGLGMGPIKGLENMRKVIKEVIRGGANGVIIHKGIAKSSWFPCSSALIIHLTGSTELAPDPNSKVKVCSVEEAIKLGADGVSVHINIGAPTESEMLKELGKTAEECEEWDVPLLAMMYPKIKELKTDAIALITRTAYELGADIIKVPYTGDIETFRKVVEGVDVPVVVAGGAKTEIEETLRIIKESLEAGGAGVACGRNVFQSHQPARVVNAISKIVHKNISISEGIKIALGEV